VHIQGLFVSNNGGYGVQNIRLQFLPAYESATSGGSQSLIDHLDYRP